MQDASAVARFLDDGDDVVAEYVDEDGNGTVDRKRIYWPSPAETGTSRGGWILRVIDQGIGFVDIDVQTGAKKFYYYLCDQVGSVMQVVDEQGTVVNQYDYHAFGCRIHRNTYETVENRYQFQGREYDEHRKDYYFRNRTYVPEWGMFTGPDAKVGIDPNGPCNYLFTGNNPTQLMDPTGLYGRDVHEDLTYMLALAAGIRETEAAAIAAGNQAADDEIPPVLSTVLATLHYWSRAVMVSILHLPGACSPGDQGMVDRKRRATIQILGALEEAAFRGEGCFVIENWWLAPGARERMTVTLRGKTCTFTQYVAQPSAHQVCRERGLLRNQHNGPSENARALSPLRAGFIRTPRGQGRSREARHNGPGHERSGQGHTP